MKRYIFFIAIAALAASCHSSDKMPDNFDYGQVTNGVYSNKFFDFSIPAPKTWHISSKEELKQVMADGASVIEKNNKTLAKQIRASEVRYASLFAASRYSDDSTNGRFNSSVGIVAENLAGSSKFKTGEDYLNTTRELLGQTGYNYTFEPGYEQETIANKKFYILKTTAKMNDVNVHQLYYSTIDHGFALGLIATYSDDDDEQEFRHIFSNMTTFK